MRASTKRRHKERLRRQRTEYVKSMMRQRKSELTDRLIAPHKERWMLPRHISDAVGRVNRLSLKEIENFPYEADDSELLGLLALKLRDWAEYRDGVPVDWLLNFHGIDPEETPATLTINKPVPGSAGAVLNIGSAPGMNHFTIQGQPLASGAGWHAVGNTARPTRLRS